MMGGHIKTGSQRNMEFATGDGKACAFGDKGPAG